MLRKINSLLFIPTGILLLAHILLMIGLLTGLLGFNPYYQYIGYTLLVLVAIHILLGIIFILGRILRRSRKHKKYGRENAAYRMQILSGIVIIVLIAIHTTAYGYTTADGVFVLRDPSLIYYCTECLLAITLFLHCRVSIPRLAVSLGFIRKQSGMRTMQKGTTVLCLIALVLVLAAFSYYYLPTILGGLV